MLQSKQVDGLIKGEPDYLLGLKSILCQTFRSNTINLFLRDMAFQNRTSLHRRNNNGSYY